VYAYAYMYISMWFLECPQEITPRHRWYAMVLENK
jgi:hypothetical protein